MAKIVVARDKRIAHIVGTMTHKLDWELNLELAKRAGIGPDGDWKDHYQYHLGAVESPLPFEVFKRKYTVLQSMLARDPDGKVAYLDKRISDLCRELGY